MIKGIMNLNILGKKKYFLYGFDSSKKGYILKY